MRINHIVWELNYGGIEAMVVNIANEQAKDHDVSIIVINKINNTDLKKRLSQNVKLIEINRKIGSINPVPIIRLNYTIWQGKPDVIHFHDVNIRQYILKYLIKKQCTTFHTTWIPSLKKFFPQNRNLFSISNKVRKDILEYAGTDSMVVYNGIEFSRYRHHEFNADSKQFRIVQIGRIECSIKGQDIAVRAIKILAENGLYPTLDFIGDGSSRADLQQLINDLGLSDRITICGFRTPEYIQEHLADYDLLIQPSRIEGFGLTVAEGMAAKVPVAVSDLPALIEVTDNGNCGLLFKTESPGDCAKALEIAMTENLQSMAERSFTFAQRRYDVLSTAKEYLKAYMNLK